MTQNIGHNEDDFGASISDAQSSSNPIDTRGYGGGLAIRIPAAKEATAVKLGFAGLISKDADPEDASNYERIRNDTDGALIEQDIPVEDQLYVIRPEIAIFGIIKVVFLTSASAVDAQTTGFGFRFFKLG